MLYKVLDRDGRAANGGQGQWSLPCDGRPGGWMPPIEKLEMCMWGYHLVDADHLIEWLGPTIYEAEADTEGEIVENGKHCVHTARLLRQLDTWTERAARLLACDCVEHVLPVYERLYSGDERPRVAIAIARRFVDGQATQEELTVPQPAAWAAARAAAWDAAWAVAWAAAQAAAQAAA